VTAYAYLAMLRATCPDQQFRDGKQALDLAQKALQLDGGKIGESYAALAAAHAELGDFKQAVQMQNKAIELFHDALEKRIAQERLQVYQSGKPWREPAISDSPEVTNEVAAVGESE
jgi:tetratricopeptide (TPR) repeat protein